MIEAASFIQLEAVLLDRDGAPSLFVSVAFVKKQRERVLVVSLSLSLLGSTRVLSMGGRERAARREKKAQPPDRQTKSITLHVGIEQLHICSCAVLRLTFEDHLRKLEAT